MECQINVSSDSQPTGVWLLPFFPTRTGLVIGATGGQSVVLFWWGWVSAFDLKAFAAEVVRRAGSGESCHPITPTTPGCPIPGLQFFLSGVWLMCFLPHNVRRGRVEVGNLGCQRLALLSQRSQSVLHPAVFSAQLLHLWLEGCCCRSLLSGFWFCLDVDELLKWGVLDVSKDGMAAPPAQQHDQSGAESHPHQCLGAADPEAMAMESLHGPIGSLSLSLHVGFLQNSPDGLNGVDLGHVFIVLQEERSIICVVPCILREDQCVLHAVVRAQLRRDGLAHAFVCALCKFTLGAGLGGRQCPRYRHSPGVQSDMPSECGGQFYLSGQEEAAQHHQVVVDAELISFQCEVYVRQVTEVKAVLEFSWALSPFYGPDHILDEDLQVLGQGSILHDVLFLGRSKVQLCRAITAPLEGCSHCLDELRCQW